MAEILRHKKTGGLYEVLSRCVQIQTSEPLADYAKAVAYRDLNGGPVWVRPTSEMDDGRFEPVHPDSTTPSGDGVDGRSVSAEVADLIRTHAFRDLHSPEAITAGISDAADAILASIASSSGPDGNVNAFAAALWADMRDRCAFDTLTEGDLREALGRVWYAGLSGSAGTITVRDDVKCCCVSSFGPNAECGACGGSGCITAEVPTPPDLIQAAREAEKILTTVNRSGCLPDCMMPDGAEPCKSFQEQDEAIRAVLALFHAALQAPHQGLEDGRRPDGHGLSEKAEVERILAMSGEELDAQIRRDGRDPDDVLALANYAFRTAAMQVALETISSQYVTNRGDMTAEEALAAIKGIAASASDQRAEREDGVSQPRPEAASPVGGAEAPASKDQANPAPTTGSEAPGRDDGWRSMDSAPRDGSWFEAWIPRRPADEAELAVAGVHTLRWSAKGFWWNAWTSFSHPEDYPTGWRPLSASPRSSQKESGDA